MGHAHRRSTADKPNYAIQRNSGDTHWLWSPNALSTSTVGVRLSQKIGDNWEIVGAVEAGFNPYTLRLINGPAIAGRQQSLHARRTRGPLLIPRAPEHGTTGKASSALSNPTFGTLTFGRTTLLSMSALSAYDPVASVAFSQLGFTALYATFGASPTSRINTAFTYRLTYQGFRVAAQAQVGGYDQDNAATEQYQAQIGTDFNGFSFDAIAGYAKNALTFQSFAGATTAGRLQSVLDCSRDGREHGRRRAARPLRMGKIQVLRRIYLLALRQSEQSELTRTGWRSIAPGVIVPPGFVTINAYTVPRVLDTVWTGLRYAVWSNLDLAAGVYSESQNDFLAAPAVCTGSGSATSSTRCAGGRCSYSFLADYRPIPRVSLYAGLLVSTVYGGVASGFCTPKTSRRPSACGFASDSRSAGVAADAALHAIVGIAAEPVVVAVSGMSIGLEHLDCRRGRHGLDRSARPLSGRRGRPGGVVRPIVMGMRTVPAMDLERCRGSLGLRVGGRRSRQQCGERESDVAMSSLRPLACARERAS